MTRYLTPEDLLRTLGVRAPQDIDIEAIAFECGATVTYEPLQGCEAQILGYGDRAFISVREDVSRGRQRFSAAHELGHWMRDRGKGLTSLCGAKEISMWGSGGRDRERRANRYAAELLLPIYLFQPDVQGREITLSVAYVLAARYQVSRTAAAIRLAELGSYPAMVVCCEKRSGRRLWWVSGPDIPDEFRPVTDLVEGSLAYDLAGGGNHDPEGVELGADCWIEAPDSDRYRVVESSFVVQDRVVSLLWWRDQEQLLTHLGSLSEG